MRRLFLACMLILGIGAALPSPAAAQMRDGLYDVLGQNPDGSSYQGVLEMRGSQGGAWLVGWQIGDMVVQGVGVVQGGVLAVGYALNGQPGVATYEVQRDGKLSGFWTIGAGIGTETLTPR